jgi:hypothetical protein
VPSDGKRDIPDISFFASNGVLNNFYIFCESDSFANCAVSQFGAAGGTSFGAPIFAGIMALINQKMNTPEGQGIANYVLYKLASQQTASSCNSSSGSGTNCVFNDVTSGTIAMPCAAGSRDCTVKTAGHQFGILNGYDTTTGFDLATGLGSVNVANLVNKWSSVTFRPTTTSLALSPTSSLTHGQGVTVTGAVAPSSGTGTPTGKVSLLTSTGLSVDGFTLTNGALSGTTNLLPGGTYTVSAHYGGDPTFGGSDSTPVSVTVGKENSSTQINLITFDWNGNLISGNATSAVYGSPYIMRMNVLNSAGSTCTPNPFGESACPTGSLTVTDNGNPLDGGTFSLNSQGYTEDQTIQLPGGSNSIGASYAGDNSFNASSKTSTVAISPAPTTTQTPTWSGSAVVGGGGVFLAGIQSAPTSGVAPTGTATFFVNGTAMAGQAFFSPSTGGSSGNNFTASAQAELAPSTSPFPTPGTYNITSSYSGDANYQSSTSLPLVLSIKFQVPSIGLRASSTSVTSGSNITLTATILGESTTIAPTGTISVAGQEGALPAAVSYTTITDPNTGNLDLQGTITFPVAFTDTYMAGYSGDSNYPAVSPNFSPFVQVTVTGSDFSLTTSQPSVTVQPGFSANMPLFIGMQSSTAPIAFGQSACSGLPQEAGCTIFPDPISSSGAVTVSITTSAPHTVATKFNPLTGVVFALLTPFGLLLLASPRKRTWQRRKLSIIGTLILLTLGCGGSGTSGGGGGGGGGPKTDPGTPAGSYTITVTGTSGTGGSAITHTTSFTLVVQ